MLPLTHVYLYGFGALTIAGGVVGYVKAKSRASLVAGGVAGALLVASGVLVGSGNVRAGLGLGLVVSLGLAGRFVPAYVKTRKPMPAGMMAVGSIVGAGLTAASFFVG